MTLKINIHIEAEDAVNLPEEKLSPWFGPEIDPVHNGIYLTEDAEENPDDFFFNMFKDGKWYWGNWVLDDVDAFSVMPKSNVKRWRGLAEKDLGIA